MFEHDEFGLFNSTRHIENFLFYLNKFYLGTFQNLEYSLLPENELAFLYMISDIFNKPLIEENQDFSELILVVENKHSKLNEDMQVIIEIAYSLLHHSIHVYDMRKISPEAGVLIKNAIDILSENHDIVQLKKFDVLSISQEYGAARAKINESYDLIL